MYNNKYHAHKTTVNGLVFDSRKEAERYIFLRAMERSHQIKDLQRQVKYELIPKQEGERAVSYIADFVYKKGEEIIVEDTKGVKTPEYIIKRKLMLWVHGIKIKEV